MKETSNKIVSVIIVTTGLKDYLKFCLNSVRKQTHPKLEIIIVSNTSKQAFSEKINNSYADIKLYSGQENLLYCGALNTGIKASKGDFVLCLNDDVILDERFIEKALRGFAFDDSVGMVSGKILRSGGRLIDSTGLFLTIWRTARERGYGLKDKGQYEKSGYVFGVNGAVAFYRRDMLERSKIGFNYFDEDYHIFYEDLDIAWRGHNLGWKGYYIPSAIAYHVRGGSVRAAYGINKPFARRYLNNDLHLDLLKNRHLTLIKNESALGFLLHLPFIFLYDILTLSYILFCSPALITKLPISLKYIGSAFKKRRLIKRINKLSNY